MSEMLSEEAKAALRAAPGDRIGTQIHKSGKCTGRALRELTEAGLIGPNFGLTRAGSILAERLKSAELDRLFG